MIADHEPGRHDYVAIAPELEPFNLVDKPEGPAAAAMIAAGVGIFFLGLFTTLAVINSSVKSFLEWWQWGQGVGPLAGKTTVSVLIWLVTWAILYLAWRDKDVKIKVAFYIGLALGVLGAIGMFPPFFEAFE